MHAVEERLRSLGTSQDQLVPRHNIYRLRTIIHSSNNNNACSTEEHISTKFQERKKGFQQQKMHMYIIGPYTAASSHCNTNYMQTWTNLTYVRSTNFRHGLYICKQQNRQHTLNTTGMFSLVPRPFAREGRIWTCCNRQVVQVECNNLFEKRHNTSIRINTHQE